MTAAPTMAEVQDRLAMWWYDYDAADLPKWSRHFTPDASYVSKSDSGMSRFEDVVRGNYPDRDAILGDLYRHRINGLTPIRHLCMNVHVDEVSDGLAEFRSYLLVLRVADSQALPIATARCTGSMRRTEDSVKIASMQAVFDLSDSVPLSSVDRGQGSNVTAQPTGLPTKSRCGEAS